MKKIMIIMLILVTTMSVSGTSKQRHKRDIIKWQCVKIKKEYVKKYPFLKKEIYSLYEKQKRTKKISAYRLKNQIQEVYGMYCFKLKKKREAKEKLKQKQLAEDLRKNNPIKGFREYILGDKVSDLIIDSLGKRDMFGYCFIPVKPDNDFEDIKIFYTNINHIIYEIVIKSKTYNLSMSDNIKRGKLYSLIIKNYREKFKDEKLVEEYSKIDWNFTYFECGERKIIVSNGGINTQNLYHNQAMGKVKNMIKYKNYKRNNKAVITIRITAKEFANNAGAELTAESRQDIDL